MRKNSKLPALRINRETLTLLTHHRLAQVIGGSQSVIGHPCGHSNLEACVEVPAQ